MNSLYKIMTVLAAIVMIGSAGTSLQQVSAKDSGVSGKDITMDFKGAWDAASEQFQQDVLDLVTGDPPGELEPSDLDKLATLFDNYEQETFRIFGADPPGELEPPDPDLEPPDPDKS